MFHNYLKQLLFVLLTVALASSVVCTAKPKEEEENPKEAIIKAINATFDSPGFHIKGKGLFTATGPKTNIRIESALSGITQKPDLSYLVIESEDTGEKAEIYRQGKNAVMRSNKNAKWAKQPVASPAEFIETYKNTLENIKFVYSEQSESVKEEKINDKPCRVIEATLTNDGINNLLTLYKMAILPNSEKTSRGEIWIGKEDNLIYKINVKVEITAENPSFIPPDEEESGEPKKKRTQKTNVKLEATISCFDYDKDINIKIPDEVKKVLTDKKEENKE